MKKNLLFVYCMLFITALNAQQEAGFENLNLKAGSFKNGSDGAGGFTSGGFRFLNSYLPEWYSWSGFAVSAVTDNQLKGWENQYCAIPGRGALNTSSYAVSYVFDKSVVEFPETVVTGFYVTNNTYTYWSMKEGDFFSKKFGGVSGKDPDWFKLTVTGIRKNGETAGTFDFYLADYRSESPLQDYIVNDWKWIGLASFGPVVKLNFTLSSSDNGDWGMNTPAYFCLDQLNHTDQAPAVINPIADITRERNDKSEIRIPLLPVFSDPDSPDERMVYSIENVQDTNIARIFLNSVFISKSPVTRDAWLSVNLKGNIGQTDITIGASSDGKKTTDTFRITAAAVTSARLIGNPLPKVYPNPFSDRITIDYNSYIQQIILTDSEGKVLLKNDVNHSGTTVLDGLDIYPAGIYFLRIQGLEDLHWVKLLKSR